MFAARGLGLYGGLGTAVTGTLYGVSAGVTFQADGVYFLSGPLFGPAPWVQPGWSGVGSLYWIRFTKTGGSRNLAGGVDNVYRSLASDIQYSLDGAGNCTGDWSLATDAGGAAVVATGTFNLNNSL